jgi:hypothetical protein
MRKLLAAVPFTLCLASASVQAQPAAQEPVTIEDAAWLAGRWIGEGLGGQVEETWAPPSGGQMAGHFRLTRDGKPVFYEFELIDEHDGGLRFRVKHFNPDFTGWEERDGWASFAFEGATSAGLRYRGLALRRVGADGMEITIRIRHPDGRVVDEVLRLRRAPL